MDKKTIKSIREFVEGMTESNSAPAAIEIYAFNDSKYKTYHDIHTDKIKSLPCEYNDNLATFPDNMPVLQCEYMDEEEYNNTIDANCEHIPFADYLEGESPRILVLVLPYNWEEYFQYYTVIAAIGEVDDVEYNDMGGYCYMKKDGVPLFSRFDRIGKQFIQRYNTEEEAKKQLAKIQKYYQEHIDFNEEVYICTIRHYMEDGELYEDDGENEVQVSYQFKDITGAVVVRWSWETHIGYAQKFYEFFQVSKFDACHDESLLVEENYVGRPQFSLIFSAEEAKELEKNGIYYERLKEELFSKRWKWTNPGCVRAVLEID